MGTDDNSVFFFEQTPFKKRQKRLKKIPDDLPKDLRHAHLNPRLAAYLAKQERDSDRGIEQGFNDGLGKNSLLPQINQTVNHLKNALDSLGNEVDSFQLLVNDAKARAEYWLEDLDTLLEYFKGTRLQIPKSLQLDLSAQYKDLIVNTRFKKREWQIPQNKQLYLQQKEKEMSKEKEFGGLPSTAPPTAPPTETGRTSTIDEDGRESSLYDLKSIRGKKGGRDSKDHGEKRGSTRCESKLDTQLEAGKSKVRLDKYKANSAEHKGSGADHKTLGLGWSAGGNHMRQGSTLNLDGADRRPSQYNDLDKSTHKADVGYWAVISFQLSNKIFEDKGWIVNPTGPQACMERNGILEWALARLQDMLQKKADEIRAASQRGDEHPIVLRFYGESRKEAMSLAHAQSHKRASSGGGPVNRNAGVWKGDKPYIPLEPKYKGKNIFQATISDGSSTVYYPSGRPAIVTSRNPGRRGSFYTFAYADVPTGGMLATFTPSGAGCVYHQSNGNINFICNDEGGSLADEEGNITKRFSWPKNHLNKMYSTVVVPVMRTNDYQVHYGEKMNPSITLRCAGHHHMKLFYACGRESVKFNVGCGVGKDKESPPSREEMGSIMSDCKFSSKTALAFQKPYNKPPQIKINKKQSTPSKGMKHKGPSKGISEVTKILAYPEPVQNDEDADKQLFRLQRKVKETAESWMEHYRIAMGITSPLVEAIKDLIKLKPRMIHSAKPGGGRVIIEPTATAIPKVTHKVRVPSAPPGQQRYRPASSVTIRVNANVVAFDENLEDMEGLEQMDIDSICSGRRSVRVQSAKLASQNAPGGTDGAPTDAWNPVLGMCPVALRHFLLGDNNPKCRCSNYKVPALMDIEFDEYIRLFSTTKQLLVIVVKSSLYPDSTNEVETMMGSVYEERNRGRSRVCSQARGDQNRLFTYDMATASEMSNHTQPLLLRRHNVCPGMILIYEQGRLLFCDHIFNGYGNARKDLQKQLQQSQRLANTGQYLPKDFKFSPTKGRPGPRAAWGGEIGGTGVDHYGKTGTGLSDPKISITSMSSGDSLQNDQNMISGVNCSTKYISMRLVSGRYPQMSRSTLEAMLKKRRDEKEKKERAELDSDSETLPDMDRKDSLPLRRVHGLDQGGSKSFISTHQSNIIGIRKLTRGSLFHQNVKQHVITKSHFSHLHHK